MHTVPVCVCVCYLLTSVRLFVIPWTVGCTESSSVHGILQARILAAAAKLLQSCPTLCDPREGSAKLPRPWDSPGKNTGVGCHFLLQGMFLSPGANPCLLHLLRWQVGSLPLTTYVLMNFF